VSGDQMTRGPVWSRRSKLDAAFLAMPASVLMGVGAVLVVAPLAWGLWHHERPGGEDFSCGTLLRPDHRYFGTTCELHFGVRQAVLATVVGLGVGVFTGGVERWLPVEWSWQRRVLVAVLLGLLTALVLVAGMRQASDRAVYGYR
jgi:hypothetical protein